MSKYYRMVCIIICRNVSDESDDSDDNDTMYGIGNKKSGPCFSEPEQINPLLLALVTESDGVKTPIYNSDSRIYMKSGERIGNVKLFESKFGPAISLKIGETVKTMKNMLERKAGEPIKFYAKEESEFFCCYFNAVRNEKDEKCVNAIVNDEQRKIPLEELPELCGSIVAILKAKQVKRSEKTKELQWSLNIVELMVKPLPPDYEGNYSDKPDVKFLQKLL